MRYIKEKLLAKVMQRTGLVNLPLHSGKAPPWLFKRMVRLAGAISSALVYEYGNDEFLRRISNPYWFQALSCVIGFDWHSSGTTTTTCGALKESVNKLNLGIRVAGGKGKTSRKTPDEIGDSDLGLSTENINRLVYSSKLSAKVDTSLIQDGYQLYHHCLMFTEKGKWAVIQQGMDEISGYARRYHWLSDNVKAFVEEPHNAICCDKKNEETLDMTAKESMESRKISLDIINDDISHITKYFNKSIQKTIGDFSDKKLIEFSMTPRHAMIDMNKRNIETLRKAHEFQPGTYEELVAIKGIGPKSIRALALISGLVYGKQASWKDPVKYSFAHGGKDGFPYPVDKEAYDRSILTLMEAVEMAKIGEKDRLHAIRRLDNLYHRSCCSH